MAARRGRNSQPVETGGHRPPLLQGGSIVQGDLEKKQMEQLKQYLNCPCAWIPSMTEDRPILDAYQQARRRGEREGFWTLDAKQGKDIMVLGISEQEISREYRISRLSEDFQYAVTVASVSDNRNRPRLKHIKVTGK